ncbi:uncharacterized protein LOC133159828 isoform X2 [Syngnathus typhle]|uniref:uncharacterized protein LOC133159828 isoform X2 n=1 Tax=Syngnathus typhle TaxID=161592 RepID=UPI002A69D17D|nr:uncharacterized protein LOC133159828 isoform X2 [Syngnathus typhle]
MSHFPCPERSSHLYGDDYRYSDRREAASIGQLKFGSFSKCMRCSWMLQWNSEADEGVVGSVGHPFQWQAESRGDAQKGTKAPQAAREDPQRLGEGLHCGASNEIPGF